MIHDYTGTVEGFRVYPRLDGGPAYVWATAYLERFPQVWHHGPGRLLLVERSASRRDSTRVCRWGNLGGGYVVGAQPVLFFNDRPDARLSFTPAAWPGFVFRSCAALPFGFPPVCAAQGHRGKRLVSGPRPVAGSVDIHRNRAKYKGAAIRSPGRCSLWATASQAPRVRWGVPLR